jgi:hypothetical protein
MAFRIGGPISTALARSLPSPVRLRINSRGRQGKLFPFLWAGRAFLPSDTSKFAGRRAPGGDKAKRSPPPMRYSQRPLSTKFASLGEDGMGLTAVCNLACAAIAVSAFAAISSALLGASQAKHLDSKLARLSLATENPIRIGPPPPFYIAEALCGGAILISDIEPARLHNL